MTPTFMTLDAFEANLLLHGPDLAIWPEAVRDQAFTLLKANDDAVDLLEEMTSLEALNQTALTSDIAPGVISARLQHSLNQRIEQESTWSWFPLKGLLALGSLAGLGGATAAFLVPAGLSTGFLLSIAMGGMIP